MVKVRDNDSRKLEPVLVMQVLNYHHMTACIMPLSARIIEHDAIHTRLGIVGNK